MFAGVVRHLQGQGLVRGRLGRPYPVVSSHNEPVAPVVYVERAAVRPFGIKTYSRHFNCYVVDADGTKRLWVAQSAGAPPCKIYNAGEPPVVSKDQVKGATLVGHSH